MKKFLVVLAVAVNGLVFGQDYGDSLVKKEFVSTKTVEYWMVRYINIERTKLGLDTLIVASEPDQIAKTHSAWMLRTGKYEHSKLNIAEIIIDGGRGSNRYSHKFIARASVNAWMDSPGHRAHIVNPYFKYIGAGYSYTARLSDGYISDYYTVTFR
jgi:uncharacterized protein YkwD